MWEEIMKKANKKRNPVARTLKTFTQKIVPDKKKYDRKKKQKVHFPFRLKLLQAHVMHVNYILC
jgi:hypothetical protein